MSAVRSGLDVDLDNSRVIEIDALERDLAHAQVEGLRANFGRWVRFAGYGRDEAVELQALQVPSGFARVARFAYAPSFDVAVRLLGQAEKFGASGIYVIANRLDPAVVTRAETGQWRNAEKNGGTSDRDIAARLVLYLDFDFERPSGTSATDDQVTQTAVIASRAYADIAALVGGRAPLAYGHSGNGRAIFVALEPAPDEAVSPLIAAALVAAKARYSAGSVKVDSSVSEAKRLVPAFGTTKRKGAPELAERPHRRTAIVCARQQRRLSVGELRDLVTALGAGLEGTARVDFEKALGIKSARFSPAPPSTVTRVHPKQDSPFARANAVDVTRVLSDLGLHDGTAPICPGCRLSDSGVAVVGNGLKCSHNRCADKGFAKGFRTTVDVVMEAKSIESVEAVRWLSERYGFDGFRAAPVAPIADEPDYVVESAAQVAEPVPPLAWLCEGLRFARGSLTIVGGYGYSRKTLFAQALALSIATGKKMLDVYTCDHQVALHIDYEQGKRITRERYQRKARAMGVDLRDALLKVTTFPRFKLSSPEARDTLRRLLEETGAKFVVLDSLRASLSGVEENSSEIREYLDLVGQELKRVDAAGLIIHHARKPVEGKSAGGRYSLRGSGAIFDACDSVFIFTGEKGETTIVEHEKDRLIGRELASFGLDSEDVVYVDAETGAFLDLRWGLRLVHREAEQLRQRDDSAARARVLAGHNDRTKQVAEYLQRLSDNTFKGTRSDLAKLVGGRKTDVLSTLGDLVSTGRVIEVAVGGKKGGLKWVGP